MLDSIERTSSQPYVWQPPAETYAQKENAAHRRFGAQLLAATLSLLTVGVVPNLAWAASSAELTEQEAQLLVEKQGSTRFKPSKTYVSPVIYGAGPCGIQHDMMAHFQVLATNDQDWQHVYVCDGLFTDPVVVYGDVIEL